LHFSFNLIPFGTQNTSSRGTVVHTEPSNSVDSQCWPLHLALKLSMCGAIPLRPYICLHGSDRDIFTLR